MKKKVIISVIAVVICAAIFTAVILINSNTAEKETETFKSSSELLSAGEIEKADTPAGFVLKYSDRLNGYQATDIKADDGIIEVTYGSAGYVSKTNSSSESSADKTGPGDEEKEYSQSNEYDINNLKVTFKGDDDMVYLAQWSSNGFDYTISSNNGVSAEDMTEYVKATW